jgi:hypothetical protein
MRAGPFAALAVSLALAGCSSGGADPTPCYADMPRASSLLADPAFAAFTHHVNQPPNWHRPAGSDLWADARFDYASGLQYQSASVKDPKASDDLCAFAISMRFSIPPRDIDMRKLHAFAQAVAPAVKVDAAALEARLGEVLRSGDKFRPRESASQVAIEAGKLYHPTRGDFFLVSLTWPTPWITAR